MDREQEEIQFLGFFGIFKEALNLRSKSRNSCSEKSSIISMHALDHTITDQMESPKYSDILSSELIAFWLFKMAYLIFSLIFSLISTSAVVYTIACVYTAKEVTYKKVMKVVPKVWKRLMVTFIWSIIIVFALVIVLLLLVALWAVTLGPSAIGITIGIVILLAYMSAFVYIGFMWHLAAIISVLEDVYGIQAMFKSKSLIKGNTGLCAAIFLVDKLCFIGIHLGFKSSVVSGETVLGKICYGYLWFMLLSILILFTLVIQTIIYFICKSYHHENIDKLSLADHLEVYSGDYVPLNYKDVQLQHSEV
ncbi:putative Kinase family protein with leucine-rich repeat domain [Heracleum sosnowskyi]|uniref:Kinase family protein with leucine-rich repeat domain n=1 Tax=Heracleum sosnowskyi TaxID=360622 RepID=A0AAD8HYC8_9APIA|nr:putative Kinase family protein with leucine-rich repeat domain [Heracleum sosnowskyi]